MGVAQRRAVDDLCPLALAATNGLWMTLSTSPDELLIPGVRPLVGSKVACLPPEELLQSFSFSLRHIIGVKYSEGQLPYMPMLKPDQSTTNQVSIAVVIGQRKDASDAELAHCGREGSVFDVAMSTWCITSLPGAIKCTPIQHTCVIKL